MPTAAEMDSDEGMEFISAGEEEAILAASWLPKDRQQLGEGLQKEPDFPQSGREQEQTLTGPTQESTGTGSAKREEGLPLSGLPKEGEVLTDLTGVEQLIQPQASMASVGLQRRSMLDDTLLMDATLQAGSTLPSPGQGTPALPARDAGSFQGDLTAERREGLDSCQTQGKLTEELSKQLKLTQGPKMQKTTKKIASFMEKGSEQGQEGPVGRMSDAGMCDPKVKVTTDLKLTKITEIGKEMETTARKSPEPTGRELEGVEEAPTRELQRGETQAEGNPPRENLSKQKTWTKTQDIMPHNPKLTQKVDKSNKELLPQRIPLSETSGTDTEMEEMLRQTEVLENMVGVTFKNMREKAERDSDYAGMVQQFLQIDWQPTLAKERSQSGKTEKERKGGKKQPEKTDWSLEMSAGKERDRSPLKPDRTQGMLEEQVGAEEVVYRKAGWSLRSPCKSPRYKTRKIPDDESMESGLETDARWWRDEAENLESLSETFSDDELISERETNRDTLPSDQTWETCSEGQYGKKDPRLENWEEELRGPPDLIHQLILIPPYSETHMVKLWGYIAGHMDLEPAIVTKDFSKLGQQKIFGMLTKTKKHLLEVLTENTSLSDKEACRLRALVLAVTRKIICMRAMKKTKNRYPDWLQEEELVRMLQGVQRHWERRVADDKGSEMVLSPFLKDMGDPRSVMTGAEFADWLATVVSHLKLRRKELWEQMKTEKRMLEESRPVTLLPARKGNPMTPERRRMHDRARQRAVEEDSTDGGGEESGKARHGGQGMSPRAGMSPQTGELGGKGRRENRSPGLARSSEPTPTQSFEAETEGRGKEKQIKAKKALFKEGKGSQGGANGGGKELAIPASVKASWGSEVEDAEKADKQREEGVEKKRRRREEPSSERGQTGPKLPDTRPVPDLPPVKETTVTGAEKETLGPSEVRAAEKSREKTGTEPGGPGGASKDNEEAGGRSQRPQARSGAAKETTKSSGGQKGPQGVGGDQRGSEGLAGDPGALRGEEQTVRPKVSKGQPPAPRAGGVSYAGAVARATGTGSGSARGPFRGLARSDLDILEDEEFLQRFYESIPEEQDPRQRYVVRFQYKGEDPNKLSRQYVGRDILMNQLNVPKEHIMALIIPLGSKEIDICWASETTYQRFWDVLRIKKQLDPSFLLDYNIIPLFRGDTRVLTVSFRTTVIPPEDVAKWLQRRCRVLMDPEKKVDENGFWTGEYRVIVALHRDPVSGRIRHLPKYFFLGADRGITRYGGQPPACFRCGGFDHMRKFCPASLCSKCGTRGHNTADCQQEVSCSLCAKRGHVYRFCPESELNIRYPETFKREWERANKARQEEEGAGQQERETGNGDPAQGAAGPMGGRETMSKRKRREEARVFSQGEERRKPVVQAMCSTANRFGVLQEEEEEEIVDMEVVAEETGQRKSQRQEGKRVRKRREPTGQTPVMGEKTTDELYVRQRKLRACRAALASEREWWEDRQKAKPSVEGEKNIGELREEEKELLIDLEILDMQIEEKVMREWEQAEVEEKREKERREGKETEEETLAPPDQIEEEVEAEMGQEKGNKMGKEKHGLVPDPPDPPDGEVALTEQLQPGAVAKIK